MSGNYNSISLINPDNYVFESCSLIDADDLKCLAGNYFWSRDFDIAEFITNDIEVIKHRQEIFYDMLTEPRVSNLIKELLPMLETINELYKMRECSHETENHVYSIKLIETYISFVKAIVTKANEFKDSIKSRSLLGFITALNDISESDEFKNLVKNTEKLSHDINTIKSVTVCMNLDPCFNAYEFGILSLNSEPIVSKSLIDRLLSKREEHDFSSLCDLQVTSRHFTKEEKSFVDMAINSAMNKLLKSTIREWEPVIKAFFRKETKKFLPLMKECKYLLFGANLMNELREHGLPLAKPVMKAKEDKSFRIKNLYNPIVALNLKEIVYNDIEFDQNGMIYLLTGPNSGGKSVFMTSVGICQLFAQLGFLVPAKNAEISPVDHIYVNYTNKSDSKKAGRLEEECIKMKNVFSSLTQYGLVLMDETFSSTSSYEGQHIAYDVVAGLASYGCRAMFSTHIHELIPMIQTINDNPNTLSKVDSLIVCIDSDGKRTYKVSRSVSDGKSYAKTISDKYGLSYESIISSKQHKT